MPPLEKEVLEGIECDQSTKDDNFVQDVTLGDYAYFLVKKQVYAILKQKAGVLKNVDPEPLHQMRVAMRRLRTVLQVFEPTLNLPKPLREPALRKFAKQLGKLRDLDVQLICLQQQYAPRLDKAENKQLETIQNSFCDRQRHAFKAVQGLLTSDRFKNWKTQWEQWLEKPIYRGCYDCRVLTALPDLLMPVLSSFLLHPAWFILEAYPSPQEMQQLHDLRKRCKYLRYEAEFFAEFYDGSFRKWIQQLKGLQECLGQVQDTEVLLQLVQPHLSGENPRSLLEDLMNSDRQEALQNWNQLRQDYLNPTFRYELYKRVLQPQWTPAQI